MSRDEKSKDKKKPHVEMREASSLEELTRVLEEAAGRLVVIDFFADWCFPCKLMSPLVLELALTHTEVIFVKVDIDESDEIVARYEVNSVPTFVFIKGGRKLDSVTGANYPLLSEKLVEHKTPLPTEEITT